LQFPTQGRPLAAPARSHADPEPEALRRSTMKIQLAFAPLALLVLVPAERGRAAEPPRAGDGRAATLAACASLPLAFVENQGQTHARVRFVAQGARYALYLTPDAATLAFAGAAEPSRPGLAVALRFLGGDPAVAPEGRERAPGEVNYLRGDD